MLNHRTLYQLVALLLAMVFTGTTYIRSTFFCHFPLLINCSYFLIILRFVVIKKQHSHIHWFSEKNRYFFLFLHLLKESDSPCKVNEFFPQYVPMSSVSNERKMCSKHRWRELSLSAPTNHHKWSARFTAVHFNEHSFLCAENIIRFEK